MTADNHTEKEIEKFDNLAQDFWDKEGVFKALHDINPIRVDFIQELISLTDKNVIDVGCGGGILSESLDFLGANVNAIDLSSVGINAAKNQQQQSNSKVKYEKISTTDFIAKQKTKADAVFCMEMLEHTDNPEQIIKDCSDMVTNNGIVVFSTINRNIKARLLAIVAAEYITSMVPKGTHDYNLFIKPSEMLRMAENSGLKPIDIIGFKYNLLTNDFSRTKDTSVNYIFAFKKL